MISIGETLRRERQRRNLDLDQVSQELKIAPRFLVAIENEKFEQLPGGVFAKSFVRQYARMLGLDEEEAATEVQRVIAPAPEASAPEPKKTVLPEFHVPRMDAWERVGDRKFAWSSSLPAFALVVVVMLVCSLVYGWWQRQRRPEAIPPPQQIADARAAARPAAMPSVAPSPGPETQAATPATGSNPQPDSAAAKPEAAVQPSAAERSADTPGAPPAAGDALANGAVKVELTASEPVWVLARSDGKYSFSGTLSPNEKRTVEAGSTVLLRLGNAGGVSITLNGKSIGDVGPRGQVRTVQLTSGGFQIVAAPKPLVDPL